MRKHWIIIAVLLCVGSWILYQQSTANGDDDDPSGTDGDDDGYSEESLGAIGMNIVDIFAKAVTLAEGGKPGDRNMRDNNPGDLEVNNASGQTGMDGPIAVFGDFASGEAALVADLTAKIAKYPGYTISQIAQRYVGTADAPNWANNVASYLAQETGQPITTQTTLGQLSQIGVGN
jgi:hypothetical protein